MKYDSPEELISTIKNLGEQICVNTEDRKEFLSKLSKDGQIIGFETQMRRKDRTPIWGSISARIVKEHQGNIRYIEGSLVDITERIEKEEAERERESAEAANLAKSAFLANMSHELRTPLNVIMGYSQLMQQNALSPTELREYLNTINRNGEHLLALINDVLEISKIESGQLTIESTTFYLPALFRDVEKAFDSSLDAKGLFFEIMGIDDVPRYVTTDENKLRQVMVNILGNAVKFTEQGGITVRVDAKDENVGAMRLAVEVQDTGIGIAEDELDKVFAYLEQTSRRQGEKKRHGPGAGYQSGLCAHDGGRYHRNQQRGQGQHFSL